MNSTKKAVNKRILLFILFLLFGYYIIFFPVINEGILCKQIRLFFTISNNSYLADVFFLGIFIATIIIANAKYVSLAQRNISKWDFLLPSLVIFVYLIHRIKVLPGQDWEFENFKFANSIKYSDSIALLVSIICFSPRKKIPVSNFGTNHLREDNLYAIRNDVLGRLSYAKGIAEFISTQNSFGSFAIGVTGNWGSGKTVFLDLIRSNLDKNLLTYKFDPWLSKDSLSISEDFFNGVSELIEPYNSTLSKKLRRYSNSILGLKKSIKEQVETVLDIIDTPLLALESQRNYIKEQLNINKFKIVIFIDDVDRLTSDEAFEVLSLIRNSFNFPNAYFFVAYDHNYLVKLIENKKIPNAAEFLLKIFQHEIDLPSYPTSILKSEFLEIIEEGKTEDQINDIRRAIDLIERKKSIISLVNNLRGIVRLSNSINLSFSKKHKQVDLVDYILLEILKLSNREIYNDIRLCLLNESEISYIQIFRASIGDEYTARFEENKFKLIYQNIDGRVTELLKLLFNRINEDHLKSIRNGDNVLRYFSDDLFGAISFEDFDVYMGNNGMINFRNFIKKSVEEGNTNTLKILLPRVQRFKNTEEFSSFVKGVLYFSNLINEYWHIGSDIFRRNYSLLRELTIDQLRSLLSILLTPHNYPYKAESVFGKQIVEETDTLKKLNCSSQEYTIIRACLFQALRSFINENSSFDSIAIELYRNAVVDTPFENEIIYSKSIIGEEFKNYLTDNFQAFLKSINYNSGNEFFEFPSYINECFGWEEFERLLMDSPTSVLQYKLITFFRYFASAGFKPIIIDPNQIWIVSDEETEYFGSNLTDQINHKTIIVNRENKMLSSQKHDLFKFSNWISHTEVLPIDESVQGGTYYFKKIINLGCPASQIYSAVIHALVDDYLKVIINGKELNYVGASFESISSVDITKELTGGTDTIEFYVTNVSSIRERIEENLDANPYDFIYTIVIQTADF